jgi:hypothetical protein
MTDFSLMDKEYNLKLYRKINKIICIERDAGKCAIHYFNKGEEVLACDVHHVFGRGKVAGDYREHYTNLMCVCRECHPLPIFTANNILKAGENLSWVLEILHKANETPINENFEHRKRGIYGK